MEREVDELYEYENCKIHNATTSKNIIKVFKGSFFIVYNNAIEKKIHVLTHH